MRGGRKWQSPKKPPLAAKSATSLSAFQRKEVWVAACIAIVVMKAAIGALNASTVFESKMELQMADGHCCNLWRTCGACANENHGQCDLCHGCGCIRSAQATHRAHGNKSGLAKLMVQPLHGLPEKPSDQKGAA